jgi:hypothetical protein
MYNWRMKKPLNKIIPIENIPYSIFHQPIAQPRLLPKTVFIHRDTAFPADVIYARQAIAHALHRHYEIVMLETFWRDLPATLKRWCVKMGARIVLCQGYREAWNSADVKWCGSVA